MNGIYLDHNATTPVDPDVLEEMLPYLKEKFGNGSSIHAFGRAAKMGIDNARSSVAKLIGAADINEIVFTSGGTESDNWALKGTAYALKAKGDHIITTSIEHSAILSSCKFLEEQGFKVTYLPVDGFGVVSPEAVKNAITDKTILVSVMLANNEVGTIEPIEDIAKIVKEKGALFHIDAVQAVGKIPVDVTSLRADMLSLSGHKLHGPKGVGALYIKKSVKIKQFQHGGHQERARRGGTENVPAIVGLGKAAEIAARDMKQDYGHVVSLRDRLQKGIEANIKYVRLNGHPEKRLPNTLNMGFKFLEGESILLNLDMEGIAASTGSACTSGSLEPSHVLTGMNIDPADAQGSIRFSLGKGNTADEIDHVVEVLPPIIERLRAMSPLYNE